MAAPENLAKMQLSGSDRFKSSTARLLMSFYTGFYDVDGIRTNPATTRSARYHALLGRVNEKLGSLSANAAFIRATAKEILDKLGAAFSSKSVSQASDSDSRKTLYASLVRDAESAFKTSEELDKSEALLKRRFASESVEAFDALRAVAKAIKNARDPDGTAGSQEILHGLSKAERISLTLTDSVKKSENARRLSDPQLQIIAQRGFGILPDKTGIVPPPIPGETPTPSAPPTA